MWAHAQRRAALIEEEKDMASAGTVEDSTEGRTRVPHRGRALMIAGASLLALGVLALVGVAIYVQYTNNFAHNAQKKLLAQWEAKPILVTDLLATKVAPGAALARITIPRINVDAIVVELANMDDRTDLNRGPGHIPGTAFPGMQGNSVISGHRTTYGAPFGRIDELKNDDEIIVETAEGKFVYKVYEQRIIDPHDMTVLSQSGDTRITLLACHPKFTASKRIMVSARLSGNTATPGVKQ